MQATWFQKNSIVQVKGYFWLADTAVAVQFVKSCCLQSNLSSSTHVTKSVSNIFHLH